MTDKEYFRMFINTIRLLWTNWPESMVDELCDLIHDSLRNNYHRWLIVGTQQESESDTKKEMARLLKNLNFLIEKYGNNNWSK